MKIVPLMLICALVGCNQPTPPVSKPRGAPWKIYHSYDSPLLSDTINCVVVNFSTFWIGTDKGANRFYNGVWQSITSDLKFRAPFGMSSAVNAVAIGTDQSVWFGLAGGGVARMNLLTGAGAPWSRFAAPDLNADYVYALAADKSGDIYIATSSGASRFLSAGSRWFKYGSGNSPIPDEPIRSAGFNPFSGTVWFGTSTQGVVSFNGDFNWNIDMPSEQPFPITSMAFGRSDIIWFGTFADWAYKYSSTFEWTHIADSAEGGGLKGNFVNAIATQNDGTVWFGTNAGLTRMKGSSWNTFSRLNSQIPSDTVTSLTLDVNENLWIGTRNGLAEYNEEGTVQ